MIVAINAIFFAKENDGEFLKKVVAGLIANHPEHTFLLITAEESGRDVLPNVASINPGTPPLKVNRWVFWMYFKIRKILKQYQPDAFINNGDFLFHFKKVPQIVFNPDLRFIQDPKIVLAGHRRINEFFGSQYYRKVEEIVVVSEPEREALQKKFKGVERKIKVIHFGALSHLAPVEYEERENIKEQYAKGFEYFLYLGFISGSDHLVNLLKSFSAFKRRQRSSMQLLIMGEKGSGFEDFQKSMLLYKYKEDVHLLTGFDLVEKQKIISSAYALIFPYRFDKRIHLLLTALKYGVPSIVPDKGSLSEAGLDSVVSFEAGNIPDLAGKMMHLFKDEKARKKLIENSRDWLEEKDFERGIFATWELIQKTAKSTFI